MYNPIQPLDGGTDRGATMLEILVAVVILGSAGVGVLVALAAAATGASVQRSVATAQSSLATAGDALVTGADDYVGCDESGTDEIRSAYEATIDAVRVDGDPDVEVVAVRFWNGTGFGDACEFAAGHRLQRIELRTTVRDETSTLAVVKRPNEAPTAGLGPLPPDDGDSGDTDGSVTVELTPGLEGA